MTATNTTIPAPEVQFALIGIDDFNIKNFLKNKNKTETLLSLIEECGLLERFREEVDVTAEPLPDKFKSYGPLILTAANVLPNSDSGKKFNAENRKLLCKLIADGKLTHVVNVDGGAKFIKLSGKDAVIDLETLEKESGIGIVVTEDDIKASVANFIEERKKQLLEDRYLTKLGPLLGALRRVNNADPVLKWADGAAVKSELERQLEALWGPKTEEDEKRATSGKKKLPRKKPLTDKELEEAAKKDGSTGSKHADRKFEARQLESAINSKELLEEHKRMTNGAPVVTRFPPEPNGYLHIGHAKAMNLSFEYAKEMGGYTLLRFDDTNPETESQEYFDAIIEMVEWLGFKPAKITATSDYFPQMHEFAIRLIKEGKAYVDFSTRDEIRKQREDMVESPYRNTDVETNLREFDNMRKGKYDEGEAVLRVKIDMKHPNPNMRDFIAYRIKYHPHPRSGDEWCIYPSYDFSHCIVDSLEYITHSLCTLEFEIRRDSYYWLLEALNIYRPHVWEFSRLNVEGALLSKRKINKLVRDGVIRGWDDPRVMTLAGLRRRGYSPEGIKKFCDEIGVTRAHGEIELVRLEQCIRADLEERCDRAFAVLEPLKVIIEDFLEDKVDYVEAPNHPRKPERGTRKLPLSRVVYIERKDFREVDDPNFFGLAPGKEVGLRYAPFKIVCTRVIKDAKTGEIKELRAKMSTTPTKPKGFIHWLSQSAPGVDPLTAEVRIYDSLFEKTPSDDTWLELLNKDSEVVLTGCFVDPIFANKEQNWKPFESKFQFERLGYFSVDSDTTDKHLVLNRVITLKEVRGFERFNKFSPTVPRK